jgi:4-carboxymuconolactone decarboxylase
MSVSGTGGRAKREQILGPKSQLLQSGLAEIDEQAAGWVDDFVFGEVWGRAGISDEERIIVAISVLATTGHHGLLRNYLFGALHKGMSPRKIQEVIATLVVYAGFPVMVDAMRTWQEVRESARRQGLDVDVAQG